MACVFQHHGQNVVIRSRGNVFRLYTICTCSASRRRGTLDIGVCVSLFAFVIVVCVVIVLDLDTDPDADDTEDVEVLDEMDIGCEGSGLRAPVCGWW
jgi:hypothetical protein